ncbi:hypothetical protein JCM8547_003746 [Rhodosporidiobolus lusitaniae]
MPKPRQVPLDPPGAVNPAMEAVAYKGHYWEGNTMSYADAVAKEMNQISRQPPGHEWTGTEVSHAFRQLRDRIMARTDALQPSLQPDRPVNDGPAPVVPAPRRQFILPDPANPYGRPLQNQDPLPTPEFLSPALAGPPNPFASRSLGHGGASAFPGGALRPLRHAVIDGDRRRRF